MGNYCYVAVVSAARGASAPTEGGKGRGHIVAAARLQLVDLCELWCHVLVLYTSIELNALYINFVK